MCSCKRCCFCSIHHAASTQCNNDIDLFPLDNFTFGTVEDIALMRRVVGPEMGVKASGGVRNYDDAVNMVAAGATRIGASAGIKIVQGELEAHGAGIPVAKPMVAAAAY